MKMDKKEVIKNIQEKRDRLESFYSKGMLTADELFRRKTILYHDLTIMISKEGFEKDAFSREELFALCGLSMKDLHIEEQSGFER